MARTTTNQTIRTRDPRDEAAQAIVFAGIVMILVGIFHAIQGIIALANETFFLLNKEYVFEFNPTTWGWINLIIGIVAVPAGIALLVNRATWARWVTGILASVSVLASFLWLPFSLIWGVIIITLDMYVLWAVTAYQPDIDDL